MAPTAANMMQLKQKQLKSRKLRDIQELIEKPYPGIELRIKDDNISTACLILSPEGQRSLHLRVNFSEDYPLTPPIVTIQSAIVHPNVFHHYICATILNDSEAYTSAYTLKSICIQLLSFFSDERIESADSGRAIDVKQYREDVREQARRFGLQPVEDVDSEGGYVCDICHFGCAGDANSPAMPGLCVSRGTTDIVDIPTTTTCPIAELPFELLLMICDELDTDELAVASNAWSRFGAALHQLIPTRNLQCFTIKKGTKDVNIGVGVMVERGNISCEFDFVSDVAFVALGVRKSIHGLDFRYWMPLALNERHWARVKGPKLNNALGKIQGDMRQNGPLINVLYAFMNDVVVKLSEKASGTPSRGSKSTLQHASEKAVESYFALFQLLVCMAIEDPSIIASARKAVDDFMAGKHSKKDVPNLGQFLIARLLSDADRGTAQTLQQQDHLTIEIVKEAIVRNVVWMLSSHNYKVSNHPELAYLEPSIVSSYRLVNTYHASATSYRLLMFQDLMRRTVLATYGGKTLQQIQGELFERHGTPPEGAAAQLAAEIRGIQEVKNFPAFFNAMNIQQPPSKERFTDFLRRSIGMSAQAGYSRVALGQDEALFLRRNLEPGVEIAHGVVPRYHHGKVSFFLR